MNERELLEKVVLQNCSAEIYYDLADCIDSTTNEELLEILLKKL